MNIGCIAVFIFIIVAGLAVVWAAHAIEGGGYDEVVKR